jgi:hypothetical protein
MATVIPTNDQLAILKDKSDASYLIAKSAQSYYQNNPTDVVAKQDYDNAVKEYLADSTAYQDALLVSMDGPTDGVTSSSSPTSGSTTSSTNSAAGASAGVTGAVSGAIASLTSSLPAPLGQAISGALSSLLGAALKTPTPTSIIPNPMHQYASWTYATSLWWLDIDDYNNLINVGDAGPGTNLSLPNSYVIAEDSGLYPNQRLPTQNGLNYNIQSIEFDTVVGHNSASKSSNMIAGKMLVVEPYGVTLLDTLIKASVSKQDNYTDRPYMIQIDFVGYDDNGNPVPSSQTNIYRKRFPITITGFSIEVTAKGAEYNIDFAAAGHQAHQNDEHSKVPKNITVTAATVDDFFNANVSTSFTSQLNSFWLQEAQDQKSQFADSISFDIDSKIAQSKIVYDKQLSLAQANPNGGGIDLSKSSFAIPSGTSIQEIINKVLIQSQFLQDQIPDPTADQTAEQTTAQNQAVLNTFKTVVQTTYGGLNSGGAPVTGSAAKDQIRSRYAKTFKYGIHQYHNYSVPHPAAPQATDSRQQTVKAYNYIYTGKNIDILDFKIVFDTTFYTAVNTYTAENAAAQPTASSATDTTKADAKTPTITMNLLGALGVIPGLSQVLNLTPIRIRNIVNDQRDNMGMNIITNPKAQVAANLMRSVYTESVSAAMASLDLKIVGDPTLLKQDDWLYTPSPTTSTNWLATIAQSLFAQQYGHIKMDDGALIASVTVNTPVDIDIDQQNQGLVSPAIGSVPSIFSGQYEIKTIKNTFSDGIFVQTLSMIRLPNSDIVGSGVIANSNNSRGTVGLNQSIQGLVNSAVQSVKGLFSSSSGSTSTPASSSPGQATYGADGAVNSAYDATRYGDG